MSDDFSAIFASMNVSLQRMEEKIAGVSMDVEKLKKDPQRAAQLLGIGSSGQVHSTPRAQSVSPPAPNQEDSLTGGKGQGGSQKQRKVTRTLCTHCYNIKRLCQPYNCAPVTKGFQEATDSTTVTQCGSEVKSLLQQLGGVDNRQVGSRLCTGVSNSLRKFAGSRKLAKSSYILR